MLKQQIPRNEWNQFCDRFSRQHQDWLVTIETEYKNIPTGILARNMNLKGVSANLRNNKDIVSFILDTSDNERLTHIITLPERIQLTETNEGVHKELRIESHNGTATLLHFRSAVPTESVDGILSFRR